MSKETQSSKKLEAAQAATDRMLAYCQTSGIEIGSDAYKALEIQVGVAFATAEANTSALNDMTILKNKKFYGRIFLVSFLATLTAGVSAVAVGTAVASRVNKQDKDGSADGEGQEQPDLFSNPEAATNRPLRAAK